MICTRTIASRLAPHYKTFRGVYSSSSNLKVAVPIPSNRFLAKTYRVGRPQAQSRSKTPTFLFPQSVRYCSYQRGTMCRGYAEGESGAMTTHGREVLPTNVKPLHYNLTLEPDFEKFTFEGKVTIE